jgi:hypothetical protein
MMNLINKHSILGILLLQMLYACTSVQKQTAVVSENSTKDSVVVIPNSKNLLLDSTILDIRLTIAYDSLKKIITFKTPTTSKEAKLLAGFNKRFTLQYQEIASATFNNEKKLLPPAPIYYKDSIALYLVSTSFGDNGCYVLFFKNKGLHHVIALPYNNRSNIDAIAYNIDKGAIVTTTPFSQQERNKNKLNYYLIERDSVVLKKTKVIYWDNYVKKAKNSTEQGILYRFMLEEFIK